MAKRTIQFSFQRCIGYVDNLISQGVLADPTLVWRLWASNEGGVVKTSYFRGKRVIISKTVGDTSKVTKND